MKLMNSNKMSFNYIYRFLIGLATLATLVSIFPEVVEANENRDSFSIAVEIPRASPDSSEYFYNHYVDQGNQALDSQNMEVALIFYERAIFRLPNGAEAYAGRALARAGLGDRSGTISDLEQAASLFQQQGNTAAYNQVQQALQQVR
ncbi:hypothetical protein E1H12_19085 [Geitlerinema sp. P-1104]|uniref:tetratricopeptide repeat protein n=1 Tax=Geitlerinema sp. P-1104 TaxID=2546230 RepID=UPI0014770FA8|nr:tetratricopeptide repeat protein [Geitlerinema sp. P-1104]NMG60557.1 hypothetical protein [Geitlerinema sp. P-1104]